MKTLSQKVHQEVAKFCHVMAEKEHRGYAQAAWFEQNGLSAIEEKLADERFQEWLKKAKELGYSESEVEVDPYISTHSEWYTWVSFNIKIPIYGKYPWAFDKINFPKNSELPKDFVVPFLEWEQREAAEEEARREAEKQAREAEKQAREQEKKEWILAHGSQYLKDCLELNVKANLEYVVERAALEYPDFTVDYADNARWDEKFSPSQEALDELKKLRAKGVDAEIVWLSSPAKVRSNEEDEHEEFYPCEAIVIRNYLGKYDLVKEI